MLDLTDSEITDIALANGFKLKEQPDGSMALNPYVITCIKAVVRANDVKRKPKGFIQKVRYIASTLRIN